MACQRGVSGNSYEKGLILRRYEVAAVIWLIDFRLSKGRISIAARNVDPFLLKADALFQEAVLRERSSIKFQNHAP